MSSAAIPPGPVPPIPVHPGKGATALGADPGRGAAAVHEHRYVVGNALRAIKVFVTAAFSVAVMGEYADEPRTPDTTDARLDNRNATNA
ncbi:hypothetical protein RM550_36230 [Streptomyces sp. DSM 41527]|uniref:Uncharacterized protein n=1 Tax=Streptomyces mooreae TaxID=3075523 RepID=A0ABU2TJH0_9ACTN|nr:hypothetical protein [Streptomyces sp. DSM 41527]MDT0461094.1 hypothetical protein [Streptomyces sp. DSM 41527]